MVQAFRVRSGLTGLLIAGCLSVLMPACKKFRSSNTLSSKEIARAYDKVLTYRDLKNIVPKGSSKNDSITIISNYVNNWVRQQAVLHKAEENLSDDQKNVEKKLEEYRNSLINYIYERELIRQQLDTSVSDADIETYYNNHLNNFQLRHNIVQVIYFRLPLNAPKIDRVRQWIRSSSPKDRKMMEEYCYQFAGDYYFNDQEWLLFDEVLKKVPIETYDQEQFLRNNRYLEIPDSSVIYFVNIKGFKIKESLSPLSFERDNIRNLIINKRKLELIAEMERSAYEEAVRDDKIKINLTR